MALESIEIEEYSEFYTLPRKVYAKRLTKELSIVVVIHGKKLSVDGHPGDWHVITTTPAGNLSKENIYTQEEFEKAFGEYSEQLDLKFKGAGKKSDNEEPEDGAEDGEGKEIDEDED